MPGYHWWVTRFQPGRGQDAYFTIRGFVHQVEITLCRWLELSDGEALVLEHGEDIDLIASIPEPELQVALECGPRERLLE
jgi:hypothetical protein